MEIQPHGEKQKLVEKLAWRSFFILAVCFIMASFYRASTSALAVDIMQDFQVGGGLMAVMSSAFFYPYGLIQLPAGIMVDRWGTRKVTSLFLFLGAIGGFLFSFAQNVPMATFGRIIIGIGMGMVFVPSLKVLLAWFPHQRYVMSVGLYLSIGAIGMLIASYPLAWISEWIGWRISMAVASAITIVLAVLVWIYIRNTPEDMGLPSPEKKINSQQEILSLKEILRQILGKYEYWMLCVWLFTIYGTFYSLTSLWAGPYLGQGYELSTNHIGVSLLMLAAGGIISPSVAGTFAYRLQLKKRTILIFSSCGAAVSAIPLLISSSIIPHVLIPIWCFFIGFFYGGFGCIAMSRIQEIFPSCVLGTATGLANVFSYAGSTFLQLISGYFIEYIAYGEQAYTIKHYSSMFSIFMLSTIIAIVCACYIKKLETN